MLGYVKITLGFIGSILATLGILYDRFGVYRVILGVLHGIFGVSIYNFPYTAMQSDENKSFENPEINSL